MPFDATIAPAPAPPGDDALRAAIDAATARIAPAWPLDRLAAVNPLWGLVDQPVQSAFAQVGALAGRRLLMPRPWYADRWAAGAFHLRHIEAVLEGRGSDLDADTLVRALDENSPTLARRSLMTDVADRARDLSHEMSWSAYVVGRISHVCASYFDGGQAETEPCREGGLYREWLTHASRDRGPGLLMGLGDFRALAKTLPADPHGAIGEALTELGVRESEHIAYLRALLMDVNGWASWCAYLRWTAELEGRADRHIEELLAIRIGWERILHRAGGMQRSGEWQRAMATWSRADEAAAEALELDWVLQEAMERAYQERLADGLRSGTPRKRNLRPKAQAAFCIDVRSEIVRRALEKVSDHAVHTLGFAGFFGLPIEYQALASDVAIPQLPGLLAPSYRVTDAHPDAATAERRRERLGFGRAWGAFKRGAISTFSFVEATGLFYGAKLLGHTLGLSRPVTTADRAGLGGHEHARRKPRLTGRAGDGRPIGLETRADLAEGILRAMSLTEVLAPVVALVGHGSSTVNNPVAAGLDCGACCGQSGEVNARAVAALLNDEAVREVLAERGLAIPADTHFVPGLHDTTTDHVSLFDRDEVPESHRAALRELEGWLAAAGDRARRERAPALGLGDLEGPALRQAIERRAKDWSEVRPEWGLAGNAAFVIAPRERCDHLDLEGRSFLHEYRWQEDDGFAVLETLMTAPMVVTHWINFQYYASTVDNQRFGSGNKVLHNVVGGHIGVFEGNGGDLRVGLPLQCLHDGERWMHTPLRLSVFIEAPRDAILDILEAHDVVRHLVDHGWIHLFQIDAETHSVHRYGGGDWTVDSASRAR